MSPLESSLEALALNYSSFGFFTSVNCLWTWIAVITTAAVSVWRIRASSPRGKSIHEPPNLTWHSSSHPTAPILSSHPVTNQAESAIPAKTFDSIGGTSGKFTLYYYYQKDEGSDGDDDVRINGGGGAGECDDDYEAVNCSRNDTWEALMKMRTGNMGWYRCQDLTVLNGSVVRLWDGCRRRNTATPSVTCGGVGEVCVVGGAGGMIY